jgi:hypothetical protein
MNISVEVAKWDARVMEERITELEAKVVSLEKEKAIWLNGYDYWKSIATGEKEDDG